MPIRHIYWSRQYGKFRYFWPRLEFFHIEVYLVSARRKFRFASDPAYLLASFPSKKFFGSDIIYQSQIVIINPPPKNRPFFLGGGSILNQIFQGEKGSNFLE